MAASLSSRRWPWLQRYNVYNKKGSTVHQCGCGDAPRVHVDGVNTARFGVDGIVQNIVASTGDSENGVLSGELQMA